MSIDDRIRAGLTANADLPPPSVERHLEVARRRRRRRVQVRVTAVAAVVTLVLVVAPLALVRSLDDRSPEPAPSDPPTVPGSYRVRVGGSGETETMTGIWKVSLGSDGSVRLDAPEGYRGPALGAGEAYDLDGDLFTTNVFLGWPGCQRTTTSVGSYRVVALDSGLDFDLVADDCLPRLLLLGSSWERSS